MIKVGEFELDFVGWSVVEGGGKSVEDLYEIVLHYGDHSFKGTASRLGGCWVLEFPIESGFEITVSVHDAPSEDGIAYLWHEGEERVDDVKIVKTGTELIVFAPSSEKLERQVIEENSVDCLIGGLPEGMSEVETLPAIPQSVLELYGLVMRKEVKVWLD